MVSPATNGELQYLYSTLISSNRSVGQYRTASKAAAAGRQGLPMCNMLIMQNVTCGQHEQSFKKCLVKRHDMTMKLISDNE